MLKAGLASQTEGPGAIGPQGTKVVQPPPSPAEIASLFPQLEILECLGRGGMGVVYKARQPRLNRLVALKILARDKEQDGQFAERFTREAQMLARLNHPNIVTVHDFGEAGGHCYLVMEFVDGLNLRQLLLTRKMPPDQALTIVPKICEALQYAHDQGIVHRDIKPENILLDKQGRVKIADFGIAKMLGVETGHQALTGAKDIMGTPHYMAPEQVEKPLTVDHRADIYSLGVVFYEMLTGELPLGKFQPPSSRMGGVQIDVRLDEVVLHTLEKEPARRYQHANQLKTDVETISGTVPPAAGFAAKRGPVPLLATPVGKATSDKIILPAFLLAFFFGIFGAHRFYVGRIWTAFLQLAALGGCILLIIACATLGMHVQPVAGISLGVLVCGCSIWATIDWILILCKAFTDGQGRRITNWFHPQTGEMKTGVTPLTGSPSTPPPSGTASSAAAPPPAPMAHEKTPANGTGKIVAPAVGLMVAGMLKLFSALTALFLLTSPGASWLGKLLEDVGADFPAHWGVMAGFSLVFLKVVPACLILFGGLQMVQLRSYAWAVAAGILGIVSCSPLAFLVGIWALIILARQDVRETFASAAVSQPPNTGNKWPWVLGMAAVAGVIVIGLIIAVVLALWPASKNPNVNVRGTVTDAVTGQPIAGARVDDDRYGADTDKAPQQTWTDKKGHYKLKTWHEEHTLAASAPGYETGRNTLVTEMFGSEREMRMDFQLQPAGMNTPAPLSTLASSPVIERANGKNAYLTSAVTKGELSQVVTATGTLNPVSSDPGKWRIITPVAEADIAMVEAGQNIAFTVDAFPNRRFTGSVLQISNAPTTIENIVAYETTLAINDPDPKFRPGMTANIKITVAHRDAALLIPNVAFRFRPPGSASANRERGSERTVYVLSGGNESTPEPVRIKTGISDGSLTEVTEGLKEGDGVVTGLASPQPAAQPAAKANPGPATLSKPYAQRTKIIGNLVTTDEFQQDFSQTLPLTADGRLSLDNVNGRIEIIGWDRNEVAIKALKHGKTRESVEAAKINIDSGPDEIVIHTEQPSSVTGFPWSWFWLKNSKRNDGIVDYAIQVPHNARLKTISSVNGRIVIEDVSGDIEASTVNGEVQARGAAANLKLSTVNGLIKAELSSLGSGQTVSLSAVNGQIEAILPAGADAEVSASTVNGGMSSEFPSLIVKKEFPLGRHLKGTLGSGGASVKASTVNGGISFRRGKDAQ
jgi:tRNA A-37 threonylcarbamoyl transferase component Bud32/TM2 domain-containing membrane protein YozV